MILKYTLPKRIEEKIELSGDEKVYYAVPFDIDKDGKWTDDSYLVVTTKKIYIFGQDEKVLSISDCEYVKAEPGVGGGILVAKHKGMPTALVHYSSKHLGRFAYVARGINILISGRFEEVISTEYEKICPNCGRAIPGTQVCRQDRFLLHENRHHGWFELSSRADEKGRR